jgi:hypothetical protein
VYTKRRSEECSTEFPGVRDIVQRSGEDILLNVSGVEIGWVLFDEGDYCENQHLRKHTIFLHITRGGGDDSRRDWLEGLLLQDSASARDAFERVGIARIDDITWLDDVAKQLACIV